MDSTTTISCMFIELPVDILLMIFPYLSAAEFLALCSTCHALQDDPELRLCSSYWSRLVKSTFRVPNQPVVESDGRRWMNLFKRMSTQTKIYTWGNDDQGCLGTGISSTHSPTEIIEQNKLGIVADLQCGGWSTVALSSKGALYMFGVLDGSRSRTRSRYSPPVALTYPRGYVDPDERYEPSTAISQFSAGRAHVLGLSDSGRIWSWGDKRLPSLHIKFWNVDTLEDESARYHPKKAGCIRSVRAGWNKSSAYVNGTGIVVWEPLSYRDIEQERASDGVLIMGSWTVPKTAFQQSTNKQDALMPEGMDVYGEVTNWAILEDFVLFVTNTGKVFAHDLEKSVERDPLPVVVASSETNHSVKAVDVQGSFRSFAIFFSDGTVLVGNQTNLEQLHNAYFGPLFADDPNPASGIPTLKRLPCLQHAGVISMAFGDHHYHALHANGTITSYGVECDMCGALGLGNWDARGFLKHQFLQEEGSMPEECFTTGRTVHFEKEKLAFLWTLGANGPNAREAIPRFEMCYRQDAVKAEVSEWFEQRLRDWDLGGGFEPSLTRVHEKTSTDINSSESSSMTDSSLAIDSTDNDGLAAYFALSVAAAGWHSGALVLVNEQRAASVRAQYLIPPVNLPLAQPTSSPGIVGSAVGFLNANLRWFLGLPTRAEEREPDESPATASEKWIWDTESFPRLRLRDGREMPGAREFSEWRRPPPEWKAIEMVELELPGLETVR